MARLGALLLVMALAPPAAAQDAAPALDLLEREGFFAKLLATH